MGRGLSDLQRWILREAGQKERLYHVDILVGFFRWPSLKRLDPRCFGYHFSRRSIGAARHARTKATLSRACRRLEARGLVTRLNGAYSCWAAVSLTDAGREWLSVNTVTECDSDNR